MSLSSPNTLPKLVVHSEFRNLFSGRVIFLSLLFCFGQLFQELISEAIFTRYEFSRPGHEVALVYGLFQQLGAVLVALITHQQLEAKPKSKTERPISPPPPLGSGTQWRTWVMLFTLTGLIFASSVLPNLALHYVYFPAKVVAKSTKLVPTMLVSVLFGNSRRFSTIDYMSALLLCLGAVMFAFSSTKLELGEDVADPSHGHAYFGLLLLGIASSADALVPNIQQLLMRTKLVHNAEDMAFSVNAIGSTWILCYLGLYAQSALDWIEIFRLEPNALLLLLSTAICSGVFVLAYTMLIQEAGSAKARRLLILI
ncbi:hypothetical protein BASA81_003247 [Batrachochytrium salamandrivorans]|nr:hypothetical protein BASA81_003247 [Batrachochytrium salamandrivorans]